MGSQTHQKVKREGRMFIMEVGLIAASLKLKSDKSLRMYIFQMIRTWKSLSYDYRLKWQLLSKLGISGSYLLHLTGILRKQIHNLIRV